LLGGVRIPVHKACLALMYACGLRISEAATLEIGAIDRANMQLRIIGKGDRERLVPFPGTKYDDQVDSTTQALDHMRVDDIVTTYVKAFGPERRLGS
jgi:site-specific recombinase XerD